MWTDPEAVAAEFKSHPALGMYYLWDEPNTTNFKHLAEVRDAIRKEDPTHLGWINLLPNYATPDQLVAESFTQYLDRYVEEVKPQFLSYDFYGIVQEAGATMLRKGFFDNLEEVSKKARKQAIPFWAFVLATPFGPHPTPAEGELRFQVFASLAYGARGIQYFTYWTPENAEGVSSYTAFKDGPISADGTKTPSLDLIGKVNSEVHSLAPALVKLTLESVKHFETIDEELEAFSPGYGIDSLRGSTVITSFFSDRDANWWVLVVNRSFELDGEVTLTLQKPINSVYEVNKQKGNLEEVKMQAEGRKQAFSVKLSPGDGRLFKLSKASDR